MSVVLDVQCFKIEKNKYIVKELAAYDGERICHYLFKPPFSFDLLETDLQREAEWLIKNYHAIQWDSGFTPVHQFPHIMQELNCKAERLYVKGKEKVEYVKKYVSKPIFELEEQPRLKKGLPRCIYHVNNYCMCALTNVFFLYDEFIMEK